MIQAKELSASELRIGNLVIAEFQGKTEIEPVENICNGYINPYTHDVVEWNMNTYFGIPLTEEWLVKAGFEKCKSEIDCFYLTEDIVIKTDGNVYYYTNYNGLLWICEIKYIHQLQNLFFCLCGKELEFTT